MRPSILRRSAPLAFVVAVTGCGAGGEGPDGPLGETQQAICPAANPVKGVDVSTYQGSVNWGAVHGAGLGFAITRIGDGLGGDNTFAPNWAGIKAAGMIRGAYQFFEPGDDPIAQANIVIAKVGVLGAGDLPVTADVEVTGGQSGGTIAANLQTWLTHVEAGTGKKPMIYTAPGWWNGNVGSSAFGSYPLWVANWGVSCPSLPSGWSNFAFWQDADNGSVAGIGGAVDTDEYNGDGAALATFAGGGADWGAQYVSQTWPLASTTITMTVNQAMDASITLKNIGQKSWDTKTKLATTQPRDRSSPFAGADWLAPNRLVNVTGSVAPGATFDFKFKFHAPSKPGMYDEFYGVVEEGVAWFSDPGQAGPPDGDIEAKFNVVEAQYHGQFVSQTFPTLQQPAIMMTTGQTMDGTISIKNIGTATWKAGETKLAPTPRDKPSAIGGAGWLSPTRVSSPPADVAPGGSFDFPVKLTAGAPGDYTQTFSLVEETVTWFADAPKGGGPPDDLIALHVIVSAGSGSSSSGASGSSGGFGGGSGAGGSGSGSGAQHDAGVPGGGGSSAPSGCSCRTAGGDERSSGAVWLAVAGVVAVAARRRRRSSSASRP